MLIFAWILVAISLIVIGFIVVKKFPVLANIDIGLIEAERQADLKRKILSDKFKRNLVKNFKAIVKILGPIGHGLSSVFKSLYNTLVNLKENYTEEKEVVAQDLAKKIEVLFAEAQDLIHKEDLNKAEAKYIEIIGLDPKNYKAFELLGENYADLEDYEEAEQTFEHTIKLKEQLQKSGVEIFDLDLAKTWFSLAEVHQKLNDLNTASDKLKKALELEPSNPRYLDKMVEVCIMMKDVEQAKAYCQRLEEANSGNKKLKEFKDKIRELESSSAKATEDEVI